MTDRYAKALQDFEYCVKFIEAIESPYHKNDFMRKTTIETIRHALANCLPELPEGYRYEHFNFAYHSPIHQVDDYCVVTVKGIGITLHGKGPTPRAAAIEAIKKIGGGE